MPLVCSTQEAISRFVSLSSLSPLSPVRACRHLSFAIYLVLLQQREIDISPFAPRPGLQLQFRILTCMPTRKRGENDVAAS